MPNPPWQTFIETLRESRLLGPSQLSEIEHTLRGPPGEPEALARDLVERQWLTPYQVEQLFQGQGRDLVLNTYVILERLGRGGMGEVFKARHRQLDRIVALKTIRTEHLGRSEAVERFHREARAAATLSHPNVVTVHDAGHQGDFHYLVMEYVEGTDLARFVKERGPLAVAQACEYIRQAALGLQHASEHGIVHRDVKPSNLLLGLTQAGLPVVKIVDFGLVRFSEHVDGEASLTPSDHWVGTPDFIAPEQARNSKLSDVRADIFSLGCTLFYLLTGQSAFPGETRTEKLAARLTGDCLRVRSLRPEVPVELEALIARMLARDPAARYQTPAAVAEALAPLAKRGVGELSPPAAIGDSSVLTVPYEPRSSSADTAARPAGSRLPRRRWVAGLGMGLASVVLIGLVWLRPSPPGRTESAGESGTGLTPVTVVNSLGMKLVRIAPGRFLMGPPAAEAGQAEDEQPQHEVHLTRPFYLAACEVTQAEYEAVTGSNPSHFRAGGPGGIAVRGVDTPRLPVEMVGWEDAQRFCRLLAERAEEKLAGRTYRLPTEAEWEYACRAGTTTAFHTGDTLPEDQAAFLHMAGAGPLAPTLRTHPVPVGSFPANAWGLHDMHGNVAEWCLDGYAAYPAGPQTDPVVTVSRFDRVTRGGAWSFRAADCRSARRSQRAPDKPNRFIGFRVVAVL